MEIIAFIPQHSANKVRGGRRARGSCQKRPEGTVTEFGLPDWRVFRRSLWEGQASRFSSPVEKNWSKLTKCGSQEDLQNCDYGNRTVPEAIPSLSTEEVELNTLAAMTILSVALFLLRGFSVVCTEKVMSEICFKIIQGGGTQTWNKIGYEYMITEVKWWVLYIISSTNAHGWLLVIAN